ncbi:PepSY domain-containing protein [Bordetella avium]|uniref:Membrane protein n=2 Tax=Bordetella avium TaxID=521 RepID=Q2KXM1_BORA1|nr:PepSY-associated TM helix domain-containing protein [Bordetella avium]AZY51568.1 PepSY domain-containing protein [Bordetella avium]RIQ16688.1 PepSY domain-containing protein [Bordetella avium]RIQ35022.1 PepSY domain-containing protein [Bordetella avium]RIQ49369.1 PepSY domain-containing protein [Bordetella avium]RIQ71861.1 PepSY domain-containing protein [Bordetella avium]
MKAGLRQRMSWLHTCCGLLCAWLLCLIFLAGSLSVFREPISHWMASEPVLPEACASLPQEAVLAAASRYLAGQQADARFWRIELPAAPSQAMKLFWRGAGGVTHEAALDPRDGALLPQPWGRKSEGGRHFMTLHYTLHAGNIGFWLVGLLTIGLLAALFSGVIVHKRIFKDCFTFRPGRGQRAWLDGHNASAVLTLPFQLMIAYTGLAIFYISYMPGPLHAVYGEQGMAGWQADLAREPPHTNTAPLPPPPQLDERMPARQQLGLLTQAAQAALDRPARMIMVERPGQPGERITVYTRPDEEKAIRQLSSPAARAVFDGASGAFTALHASVGKQTSEAAHHIMERLHVAAYGGWTIKGLYFICGLAGALMMATGAVLFTIKRRNKSAGEFGAATAAFYRMAESLNVAAIAGACLACIAYFHANRLIQADLPGRDIWEIRAFFLVWLLSLLHACLRPTRRAWLEQLCAACLLCLALPVVNALTTGQHLLAYARAGDGQAAGVESAILGFGGLFAIAALRVREGVWAAPKPGRPASAPPGYRRRVLGRLLCAVAGGYALATASATLLAQILALSGLARPAIGLSLATLLSFLIYAAAILWVFAAPRAWRDLLAATAALAALAWTMGGP